MTPPLRAGGAPVGAAHAKAQWRFPRQPLRARRVRPPQWPPPGSGWPRSPADSEAQAGRALLGRQILYRWPVQGWVLGKVATVPVTGLPGSRMCTVRYARRRSPAESALGDAAALLPVDTPYSGSGPAGRWVMLCSAQRPSTQPEPRFWL